MENTLIGPSGFAQDPPSSCFLICKLYPLGPPGLCFPAGISQREAPVRDMSTGRGGRNVFSVLSPCEIAWAS